MQPPATFSDRFAMEVVTMSGRAASVEFRFQADQVEVWHWGERAGRFDHARLDDWLADPVRPLMSESVVLSLDRSVDRDGRIAISLPDVQAWTLCPATEDELGRRTRRERARTREVARGANVTTFSQLHEELRRKRAQAREACLCSHDPIELEWQASRIQTLDEILALLP